MAARGEARPLVTLERVSVRRGDRDLLVDVEWEIRPGERWAVLGRNGAGKSVLLRVLRDAIPVSAGEVAHSLPRRRGRAAGETLPGDEILEVSFAAQAELLEGAAGYAQSRWHALEDEDVPTGRSLLGAARRTKLGRRLVDALGLERLVDRRATQLSNGERRKLLLVREASRHPALLALDNPWNGLDSASRRTLRSALRALAREGVDFLVLAHRAEDVPAPVTHVLVLDRGRVVASGRKADVLSRRDVARVLASGAEPPSSPSFSPSSSRGGRKRRGATASAPPVIEMRGVELRYDETRVLAPLDWTVRRGERWVVLGPNGAGKSALLSVVLADNPQSYANDVSLFGKRRGRGDTIWEVRARLGCVSPELHLYHRGGVTAFDVVASGLFDSIGRYRVLTRRQETRVARQLEEVGLGARGESPFRELSEGEQQLVLLARALVKRPELLVLDEPCQGLDEANRRRFLRTLDRLLEGSERTLLLVTHDLDEVPRSTTHGLLLRRGRRIRRGRASEVLG